MDTDANLLFGALALEGRHVDREQLAAACTEWAAANNGCLADVLFARGWLTPAAREEIEQAVAEQLSEHGGDARAALGKFADLAFRQAVGEVDDDRVRRTLSYLPAPSGYLPVDTIDVPQESRSRYTLTRVHSEGGLGRIWLARDTVLNREIALKEMRPDKEAGPAAWQRFMMEAQITGQLEHPNIVPVYELSGGPERDSVFYTMRFLRGRTLGEAIGEFHHRRKRGRADRLERSRLLRAFVAVCNAIAFANARGVVHRDLKPSNIMLGPFGEVIVIDWGLAKVLGQAGDADEPPVAVTGVTPALATRAGQIVGTVAYMAPEQADGRLELIDGRTDVYALGGILYAILTGRHPHTGEDTNEALQRIAQVPPPRPREVEPSVPSALDAVCVKALAKRRSHRYQTAAALADDVERWLADEPVSVYRDPLSVRFVRWVRRHRAWAISGAAALVLVAVVSIVAAVFIDRARQSEAVALRRAENSLAAERQAKAEALRRFREARRAIDLSLTGVSDVLNYYPGVQKLRVRLLEQAAADYERLAAEKSPDPDLQAESGKALLRLGRVRGLLEQWDPAESAYRRAGEAFVRLASAHPDRADFELERLKAQAGQAFAVAMCGGRDDEANQIYDAVVAEFESLVQRSPGSAECRHERGVALVNRVPLLVQANRLEEARNLLERVAPEFRELAQADGQPKYAEALATTQRTLGEVLRLMGRHDAAMKILVQAAAIYDELVDLDPTHPPYLEGRESARSTLASTLRTLGRDLQEIELYREALQDYDVLVRARPDVPGYRESRAVAHTNLAQVLHELGRNREARTALEAALEELLELRARNPGVLRYHEQTAACHTALGRVLSELNLDRDAEAYLDQALATWRELTAIHSDQPLYRRSLATARAAQAELFASLGRNDSASEAYRAAIADYREALRSDADDVWSLDLLAWCYLHYGDLLFDTQRRDEAQAAYREALALRKKLDADPDHRHALGWLLVYCRDPAVGDPARAIELAGRLTDELPHNGRYWTLLGAARYRAGEWAASRAALEKAADCSPHADCFTQLFLAMACSRCGDAEAARSAWQRATETFEQERPGHRLLIRLREEARECLEPAE
ncbi:MAG TPA: protein kinase [Planctomycetaceae bacterium]|nr:protein kinase [Planctomycetaceae bacterium]